MCMKAITSWIDRIKNNLPLLGPELVSNGDFDGNADGWTLGDGWEYLDKNPYTDTPPTCAGYSPFPKDLSHFTLQLRDMGHGYEVGNILEVGTGENPGTIQVTEISDDEVKGIVNYTILTYGDPNYVSELVGLPLIGGAGSDATMGLSYSPPDYLYQTIGIQIGHTYILKFDIIGIDENQFFSAGTIDSSNNFTTLVNDSVADSYSETFINTGEKIAFYADTSFPGSLAITNISVKEILTDPWSGRIKHNTTWTS
jgi:hypothetical protein